MVWLNPKDYKKQEYVVLRLNAPKNEKIYLDFNPVKISHEPDWNPMWEEWHCYRNPLRIYKQDYAPLLGYFNRIYPIKDAFNGTLESVFDVCFGNWIGKNDWLRFMDEIKRDLNRVNDSERIFLTDLRQCTKGYYIKQLKMDCQPTEFTALLRHRAVFS